MSFVYEPPYSSLEDFWRQYWINFQSNVLSWICSENYYFQTMSHKIKSARLECSKLMIGTDENDHPIRSLQSLLILKENILNVKCKKIKIGAIDFQELKEALAFAYRYDFIPYPFLTIAHQLFETFLEDEFVECSAVCLVLMDVKIQQLCQGPNFNYMIQPLTQLHTSYMEYFQVTDSLVLSLILNIYF